MTRACSRCGQPLKIGDYPRTLILGERSREIIAVHDPYADRHPPASIVERSVCGECARDTQEAEGLARAEAFHAREAAARAARQEPRP